jgi:hypothetical protein
LRISFQQRRFSQAQNPFRRLKMTWRNLLYSELRERRLVLITLIFAESFLLELTQGNLSRKNSDINAEELITLLYDALNNFVVVERHEEMKPAVAAICEDNSALDILNTYNRKGIIDSTSSMLLIEKYLQHYL